MFCFRRQQHEKVQQKRPAPLAHETNVKPHRVQEALVEKLRQGALDAHPEDREVRRTDLRLVIHQLRPSAGIAVCVAFPHAGEERTGVAEVRDENRQQDEGFACTEGGGYGAVLTTGP